LSFLLKHQSLVDGGFRTYAAPRDIGRYMRLSDDVSFEGWSSSQMCVTAVAAQALMQNSSARGVEEALGYIREGQEAEGYWNPYWWSGKLYATVNCIKALNAKRNDSDLGLIARGQKWIAATQLSDGSWTDSPAQTAGWPFSTALAVSGLLILPDVSFSDKIIEGVRWLLDRQLTDGSWTANHILRIPCPWTKDPWNQTVWNRGGKAINAAIKDHRRLFTTATALTALIECYNKISEGEV
jgi:squalene-hopene/tetraprenyl-beta-curcumene cyclase